MLTLSELTGCPLYIVHTSVGAGPRLAVEARARGIDVTMETCPHYLLRTTYDPDLGPTAKISPPIRDQAAQDGLWEGLIDGTLDTLGTDHVPFQKNGGDVWGREARSRLVPLGAAADAASRASSARRAPVETRPAELLNNVAKRFGLLPRKGILAVGADADLVMVDLDEERTVTHDGNGTCLYEGWTLKGLPS